MITQFSAYREGIDLLSKSGIENAKFDAMCLFEHCFNIDKTVLYASGNSAIDLDKYEKYVTLIQRRAKREPLQYIIGSWSFYGRNFFVGEGVLIPRSETETLVEKAIQHINGEKGIKVLDLCSGSGCIGLTIAAECPDSEVWLAEISEDALFFLRKNVDNFNLSNVHVVNYDILKGFDPLLFPYPDMILSNPPYVISEEIALLQEEVLEEPVLALDGGADGMKFYRALIDLWLPYLKNKGRFIFECANDQPLYVKALISDKKFVATCTNDLFGLSRFIEGEKT